MQPYKPAFNLKDYHYPSMDLLDQESKQAILKLIQPSDMHLPVLWSTDRIETIKDLDNSRNILITGSTGTGKTAFLYQIIVSLLFRMHPCQIKFILVDCKQIEFGIFQSIEKHFLAKTVDGDGIASNPDQILSTINSLSIEIDNRYKLLADAGCRDIHEYNKKFIFKQLNPQKGHQYFPYLILVIDELADCLLYKSEEISATLQKLIYNGGKVGLINIISTNQYNNSTVISAALLAGIDQRVIFRLNSREDYRRFFDTVKVPDIYQVGEFNYREFGKPYKGKEVFFSPTEIRRVCDFITQQQGYPDAFLLPEYFDEKEQDGKNFDSSDKDPLFEDAARLIVQNQMGSTSLIQRRMQLGYNRAGRLMDQLEAARIVGPNLGSKAREVLFKTELELQCFLDTLL
ncbi:DNA translocase FtsK [Chitinophagaceae bacterium LWZ2-11]